MSKEFKYFGLIYKESINDVNDDIDSIIDILNKEDLSLEDLKLCKSILLNSIDVFDTFYELNKDNLDINIYEGLKDLFVKCTYSIYEIIINNNFQLNSIFNILNYNLLYI